MSDTSIAEVTNVDREVSWPFRAGCYGHGDKVGWLSGKYDHNRVVQAFARHRIAEREACAMVAEDCLIPGAKLVAAAIRARSDRVDDISYAGVK